MKLVKNLKSLDQYVTARQDNKVYFKGELCFFKTGDSLLFLNELEKKRMIYDATLTNISAEIQQIKFDLDEQMKRIRQEILAIECNPTSLNQLSGKIIMISHLLK